jgi:hypothetical protein
MTTSTLVVKGTRYYEAEVLYRRGMLSEGDVLHFKREPRNKFDKYAVAVLVESGEKIGHVSRSVSQKYSRLVSSGAILRVVIKEVWHDGEVVRIRMLITHDADIAGKGSKRRYGKSRFEESIHEIPAVSGVYAIQNLRDSCEYIGSSGNMQNRLRQHIKALRDRTHPNEPLQKAFVSFGESAFEAQVLVRTNDCEKWEAEEIRSRRNAGVVLYNRTDDGQGVYVPVRATPVIPYRVRHVSAGEPSAPIQSAPSPSPSPPPSSQQEASSGVDGGVVVVTLVAFILFSVVFREAASWIFLCGMAWVFWKLLASK